MSPRRSPRLGAASTYTLWRFGVFFAVGGLLWLIGLRSWGLVFAALLVSLPVSLLLLRKQRAEFARDIDRRRQKRAELRAKLHGDEPWE